MFTLMLWAIATIGISASISVWVTAYLVRNVQAGALAAVVEEVHKRRVAESHVAENYVAEADQRELEPTTKPN